MTVANSAASSRIAVSGSVINALENSQWGCNINVAEIAAKVQSVREKLIAAATAGDMDSIDRLNPLLTEALAEQKAAVSTANAGAITAAKVKLSHAIGAAVKASGLATFLGEAIANVVWEIAENGDTIIAVNAKLRKSGTATSGKRESGSGRKLRNYSDGVTTLTAKELVDQHLPDALKSESLYSTGKWPTAPKFVDSALEAAKAAGHVFAEVAAPAVAEAAVEQTEPAADAAPTAETPAAS